MKSESNSIVLQNRFIMNFSTILVLSFVFCNTPVNAKNQTSLSRCINNAKTQENAKPEKYAKENCTNNILNIAVKKDGQPFAYQDESNNWKGLCIELSKRLKEQMEVQFSIEISEVKYIDSSQYENRYEDVANEEADLECGGNTIIDVTSRPDINDNITFSNDFFTSGARLLIKKENKKTIKDNLLLDRENIGVIVNTTTKSIIEELYTNAIIDSKESKEEALYSLVKNNIIAWATDSIFIESLTKQGLLFEIDFDTSITEFDISEYYIFPESHFLSYERYGLVLHVDKKEWKIYINTFLSQPGTKELIHGELRNFDNPDKLYIKYQQAKKIDLVLVFMVAPLGLIFMIYQMFFLLNSKIKQKKIAEITFATKDNFDWNNIYNSFLKIQKEEKYNNILFLGVKVDKHEDRELISAIFELSQEHNKETFKQKFSELLDNKYYSIKINLLKPRIPEFVQRAVIVASIKNFLDIIVDLFKK